MQQPYAPQKSQRKIKEATEKEMRQNQKIEEECQKREMEFHLKLRQLEMERRREEWQHELSVLQIICIGKLQ